MENMKTANLLDKVNAAIADDGTLSSEFEGLSDQLMSRHPFTTIVELQDRIAQLESTVEKLRHHSHQDGDIVVKI